MSITAFENVEDFWTVDDGKIVEDIMPDDQTPIIDVEGKGLVVVAGCANSVIVNTVRHAQKITETKRVHAVLGSFHLAKADDDRIKATADELTKLDLEFIVPCHCNGSKAVNQFMKVFGDHCRPLHTGGHIVKL